MFPLAQNGTAHDKVMNSSLHISVCVCTFRRPERLKDLLRGLAVQTTEKKFTYSIVVVDNDSEQSGRKTVEQFQREYSMELKYIVESVQSIALARNRAVAHASGQLVAFIDDDEIPPVDWLVTMLNCLLHYLADGVLGPVKPRYSVTPAPWALRAGIFDRPNSQEYPSGTVLTANQTGTGNALIKRSVLIEIHGPFKSEFGSGGEDLDFFRRAMELGKVFVWCAEAVVHETVPVERIRIVFQVKRALLRGKVALAGPSGSLVGVVKSVFACGLYITILPVSLVLGRHMFLRYLIRFCDHAGKLLALLGIHPVRQTYVLE